jgi:hypothetical protein
MPDTLITNVLALPLVAITVVTGNNEDWLDAVKYVVDDGTGLAITAMPQLDLRNITFEMEIRRTADDSEVVLGASTATGTLKVGDPPDWGFLLLQLALPEMQNMTPGSYVGDITGRDSFNTRVTIQIDLTIVEGVTRQPVNQRVLIEAPV